MHVSAAAVARLESLLGQASVVAAALLADEPEHVVRTAIPASMLEKDYPAVRRQYRDSIYAAVVGYLDSELPVTRFRTLAGRAVAEAFPPSFYLGYQESSGGTEVDEDDDAWLTERTNAELGFVDQLFESLKGLRGTVDAEAEATARADGYAATLDYINGEGRARGKLTVMLTLDGDDGDESCPECRKYKGKRHSAAWWLKRDLMRRNGNENYSCGRWGPCKHHFYLDSGEMYAE